MNNVNNLFMEAVRKNHPDMIYSLLEKRVKITKINNGPALRWALHYGHIEVVKYLIEQEVGFRLDERVLQWAIHRGYREVAKLLKKTINHSKL